MLEVTVGTLVKASNDAIFNTANTILGTYTNIIGLANQLVNIPLATNYGQFSIPPKNSQAVLAPINGSDKQLVCLGYFNETPPLSSGHTYEEGESGSYSNKYVLLQQNDGIVAYRTVASPEFKATLLNGEFVNEILLNLIEDNNVIIRNYINDTVKAIFDAHVHSAGDYVVAGVPVTLTSGTPTTPILPMILPSTKLTHDKGCIEAGNDLINDDGKLYSQT